MRRSTLAALIAAASLSTVPAYATAHHHQLTFRDIEFATSRDQREAAGQAMVAHAIPIGSPVLSARDVLRDRRAHCRKVAADGVLRCSFGAFNTIENHLQDVDWDIRVGSKDGKVDTLAVHRTGRGS